MTEVEYGGLTHSSTPVSDPTLKGSDRISVDEIKPNDVVTILKKDLYGDIGVRVIRVVKIGRQYIYGKYIYDGVESDYVSRIPIDGVIMLRGNRGDLEAEELAYSRSMRTWHDMKTEAIRKIDSELWDLRMKRIKEWETQNPPPKNPLERFFGDGV